MAGTSVPNVTLNNGVEMPILGFGVYQIPAADTEKAVTEALEVGYRHIDTAAIYANEVGVGQAIAKSGIPRSEIFLTTKLWIQADGTKSAKKEFETSLQKLGLDYVDCYLIHQPFGDIYGSWRVLESIYKEGAAKSIGVSNFYPYRLVDLILNNEIVPAVNQVETHPYFQRTKDQELMQANGVQIESWGPFAEGKNDFFNNPILTEIGKKHSKSVAQVALRWMIQRNVVVIPKTVHKDRMAENFDVFDFALDATDMETIATMDTGASVFLDHRDYEIAKMFNARK
jgi:2,5-diketo-D-gluconate reductase A